MSSFFDILKDKYKDPSGMNREDIYRQLSKDDEYLFLAHTQRVYHRANKPKTGNAMARAKSMSNPVASAFMQAIAGVDLQASAKSDLEKIPNSLKLANTIFGKEILEPEEIEKKTIKQDSFDESYYIEFCKLRKLKSRNYKLARREYNKKEEKKYDWYIKRYGT